jgi:predicted transcriptional regulator
MSESRMTPEEIHAFVNKELGDWMQNTVRLLRDRIKQKQLVFSQDLYESFETQAINATQDTLGQVSLSFLDYGRHRDINKLFYSRMPPVEILEEFVLKTGLEKFKYIPGYKQGARIPSDQIAARRIAWGIAKSRIGKTYGKPKKWFQKVFWGQISILIDKMLDGYQSASVGAVVDGLTK